MTKYLIVKCEELFDQYECDANREPMFLVDDWEKWYWENRPDYKFEVYKFEDDKECTFEKSYDTPMESGMALYYWNEGEDWGMDNPTVIAKYVNADRNTPVPDEVWAALHQGAYWVDGDEYTDKDFKNDLRSCGIASWFDEKTEKYWAYGSYEDGRYRANC